MMKQQGSVKVRLRFKVRHGYFAQLILVEYTENQDLGAI